MSSTLTTKSKSTMKAYDLVRRIEALVGEFPYQVKQLRQQVLEFLKKDKRLTQLRSTADKRANSKSVDRYESFLRDYTNTYRRCRIAIKNVRDELEEIVALYVELSDYYSAHGKHRDEKRIEREGDKFEAQQRKSLKEISELFASARELEAIDADTDELEEKTEKATASPEPEAAREEPVRRQPPRQGAYPYRMAPPYGYDPYRMPPAYQQPSFNIAPISIDVNRAVDSAMSSFIKSFEEKIGAYLERYIGADGAALSESSEVLDKIASDSAFSLEKLSEMLEGVKSLLNGISELEGSYSALEDKIKAHAETAKTLSDAQRALTRELQGMQAVGKVIAGDQATLKESQAELLDEQKALSVSGTELKETQKALSDELASLIAAQKEINEASAAILEAQNAIIQEQQAMLRGTAKLQDAQKALSEKQSQLTELQRDAAAASKKLARSQRAVSERLTPKKAKDEGSAEDTLDSAADAEKPVSSVEDGDGGEE